MTINSKLPSLATVLITTDWYGNQCSETENDPGQA